MIRTTQVPNGLIKSVVAIFGVGKSPILPPVWMIILTSFAIHHQNCRIGCDSHKRKLANKEIIQGWSDLRAISGFGTSEYKRSRRAAGLSRNAHSPHFRVVLYSVKWIKCRYITCVRLHVCERESGLFPAELRICYGYDQFVWLAVCGFSDQSLIDVWKYFAFWRRSAG